MKPVGTENKKPHQANDLRTTRILATVTTVASLTLAGCVYPPNSPSPSPSTTATAPSTAGSNPTIHAYTFPGGMVQSMSGDSTMYTRANGVVTIPEGTGRHPVVVLVHGSYPSCVDLPNDVRFTNETLSTPWKEGCPTQRATQENGITSGPDYLYTSASLAYIARALSEQGFAVVIPDVNTKERLDWGEADPEVLQTNLAKLHLDILRRIDSGHDFGLPWATDLKGRLDTTQLALVGHSSGGGYVMSAGLSNAIPGIKAVVALEPATTSLPSAPSNTPPTLVITGACDEQVQGEDVAQDVTEIAAAAPKAPLLAANIGHATHIGMLHGGGSHKVGLVTPSTAPECSDEQLAKPALQQGTAATLIADFISQSAKGTKQYNLGVVTGAKVEVSAKTDAATVTTSPAEAPKRVDPHSISFTPSTETVLPAKPDDLVLNQGGAAGHEDGQYD